MIRDALERLRVLNIFIGTLLLTSNAFFRKHLGG
jgi:hypothetical protein